MLFFYLLSMPVARLCLSLLSLSLQWGKSFLDIGLIFLEINSLAYKCFPSISPLLIKMTSYRSSHQRWSIKNGVLKYSAKFTGKHLYRTLFLNKVAGLRHLRPQPSRYAHISIFHHTLFVYYFPTPLQLFSISNSSFKLGFISVSNPKTSSRHIHRTTYETLIRLISLASLKAYNNSPIFFFIFFK